MDAVEFIRARRRLCDDNICGESCPLFYCCDDSIEDERVRQVFAVEQWAKEHPVKTRQSEFLKMWPGAEIGGDGLPSVAPCQLCVELMRDRDKVRCKSRQVCDKCRRDFWLKEI